MTTLEQTLRALAGNLKWRYRQAVEEPMVWVAARGRLMRPLRRLRFDSFGDHSFVHKPDWLYGPHKIAVGEGTMIFHGAWLSVERTAWEQPEPALKIGDGVILRGHVVISCAESVTIEDNVAIGGFSTIVDSDHVHRNVEHSVVWNPTVSEPIFIGEGTWIGDRVTILRGARIGRRCVIGAGTVVRGEIPDHSIAVGAPARIVGSTL